MISCAVPKTCLQEIQKILRAFIWGDNEMHRHVHAVNWNVVTKPKLRRGLGIRRLEKMNEACLLKLWSMVLKGKYDRSNLTMDEVVVKNSDSSLLKHLVQLWPNLSTTSYWVVRNGERIRA